MLLRLTGFSIGNTGLMTHPRHELKAFRVDLSPQPLGIKELR